MLFNTSLRSFSAQAKINRKTRQSLSAARHLIAILFSFLIMSTLAPSSSAAIGRRILSRQRSSLGSFSKLLSCCSDPEDEPAHPADSGPPDSDNTEQATRQSTRSCRLTGGLSSGHMASIQSPDSTTIVNHEERPQSERQRPRRPAENGERALSPFHNREATWFTQSCKPTRVPRAKDMREASGPTSERRGSRDAREDRGEQ